MELVKLEELVRARLEETSTKATKDSDPINKLIETVGQMSHSGSEAKSGGEAKAEDITDKIMRIVKQSQSNAGFDDLSNQDSTNDYDITALSELIPQLEEYLKQTIQEQQQASSEDQRNTGEGGTKMGGP